MIWRYLATREDGSRKAGPLFATQMGLPLERKGLRQLLRRIGDRARVEGVNVHRFRHTFAIEFLRSQANEFALQWMLGHSMLEMVRRYLAIAESDVENAHRDASPFRTGCCRTHNPCYQASIGTRSSAASTRTSPAPASAFAGESGGSPPEPVLRHALKECERGTRRDGVIAHGHDDLLFSAALCSILDRLRGKSTITYLDRIESLTWRPRSMTDLTDTPPPDFLEEPGAGVEQRRTTDPATAR